MPWGARRRAGRRDVEAVRHAGDVHELRGASTMNAYPNANQPHPGPPAPQPAPGLPVAQASPSSPPRNRAKSSNAALIWVVAGVGCLGIMGLGTLMVGLGAYAWYQSVEAIEEEDALARLYAEDGYDPYGYGGIEPGAGFAEPAVNPFAAPAADPLGAPTDAPRYVPIGDSPTQGPADALVTIVVFADYQCPFCGRVLPTLAQIRANYGDDVRIVYKNNPLPFHQDALPAAELALEARAQRGDSGFFEAHEALYASQRGLSRADLERIATALGLDPSRTRHALDGQHHRPTIQRDIALAAQVGATGTPNFFINGQVVRGAQPYAEFARVIEEQRTMANLLVASGVPRGAAYEALFGAAGL